MSADFDVRAQLTLDSRGAFAGMQRFSGSLQSMGHQLVGAQSMAGGLVGRLVGIGAAYLGLNAGIGIFRRLTGSATEYTAQLEATRIGLQSVLSSVVGAGWEEAGKMADQAFEQIKTASIKSPATSGEMFRIFQGIVGPIMNAGFEMGKVVDMTNDAVLAASALNVDYAQASRDISMMARGAAGVDVKLFSLLRSSNAIKETTEQWNTKLTAEQRVEKLAAALAKFRESGTAFGKSWVGVTSTFKGILQEAGRAFMSPIMMMGAERIGRMNSYLIENQGKIMNLLNVYGDRIADKLASAWDHAADAAFWVIDHWGTITRQIDDAMVKLHAFGAYLVDHRHAIAEIAKVYAAMSIGGKVVGQGMLATAGATSIGAQFMGLFGSKAVAGTAVAGAGAAAAMGAGTAAGTAAAGTAAAGTAAVEGAAATGAAAAGAAVSLPLVAAALIALGATVEPTIDNWDAIKSATVEMGKTTLDSFVDIGKSLWDGLRGPLYAVGSVVVSLGGILSTVLVAGFRIAANAIGWFMDGLEPISSAIMQYVVPAMKEFMVWLKEMTDLINEAAGKKTTWIEGEGPQKWAPWEQTETQTAAILAGVNAGSVKEAVRTKELAKQKMTVHNDFRGSQIKIDQRFEGDQDPDRIVLGMMQDLTRQAELRLSSGYAGAFTR